MRKSAEHIMLAVLFVALAGCGATTKMISFKSQSERTDVFQEVAENEAIPAGYADAIIKANIKTHLEDYYIGESKKSAHGKATYPFLINIDGQAALWNVAGVKHELPPYVDGRTSSDPEAGEGMKYSLEKKVRLEAGTHKVFFGLPAEPYYTVVDITVKSSGSCVLTFRPEYRYKTLPTRIPTFLHGISNYKTSFSEGAGR